MKSFYFKHYWLANDRFDKFIFLIKKLQPNVKKKEKKEKLNFERLQITYIQA